MRSALVASLLICAACRSEPPVQKPAQEASARSDTTVAAPRDTVGSGIMADSLLDAMREDSPKLIATPRGDTLSVQGGVGFGNDTLHAYAIEIYSWNGTGFVRIKRIVTMKADGYPQWSTLVRSIVAPVDSGQSVVLECQTENKHDPYVFGTVLTGSYPWSPLHAWRFDTTTVQLRETTTTNMKCLHMLGYED